MTRRSAIWRPLADRGDADAQYNLAQAYFLGRGVPQNMTLAEQWYERAARQGHERGAGQLRPAPVPERPPPRGDALDRARRRPRRSRARNMCSAPRSFNGDLVARDLPRAYALMTRAAAAEPAAGGDPARRDGAASVAAGPRARRRAGARDAHRAAAGRRSPRPAAARRPRRGRRARAAAADAAGRARRRAPARSRRRGQAAAAPGRAGRRAAGGRWRVQLGAFSSEANARRAWGAVARPAAAACSPITSAPAP